MKKKLILVCCSLLVFTMHSQKKTVEEEYHECYFSSLPDKGLKMKSMASELETILLEKNVLTDRSGESYLKLFKKILKREPLESVVNYSLIDSVNNLSYADELIHSNARCLELVKSRDDFNQSRSFKNQAKHDSIYKLDIEFGKQLDLVLSTFSKEDFSSEFSKLRVLLLLDTQAKSAFPEPLKDKPIDPELDSKNVFYLEINSESKVVMVTKTYGDRDVKTSLKKYFQNKKEESVIRLRASRAASYGKFVELTELIEEAHQEVKNEYALRNYQKEYDKLDSVNKDEIDKIYPLKIID